MNYELSILMPAIRPERWVDLYKSILSSTKRKFEIILVSPYALPKELEKGSNIKYVKDFGSPNRCFNIALMLAEGKYCTWGADDGLYQPGVLDKAINILEETDGEKTIISMATIEAARHYSEEFCFINKHDEIKSPFIPDDYRLLALGMIRTNYFKKLGGVNCMFEAHAMGHLDLSIRAQNDGADFIFLKDIAMKLTHMPGTSGDHAPMHYAQVEHDEDLYRKLYRDKDYKPVNCLNIWEWKESPAVWTRRFKDE